jgi:threonine dehydrogenase-like Zn-dependent dehydrogenase
MVRTMWAHQLVAPSTFKKEEVPLPENGALGDGQVLLRVLAGGICGSDLPYFRGALSLFGSSNSFLHGPGVPLHEVVGEVVASRHSDARVGARMVGWASANNALAEYVVTDGEGLIEYESSLSPISAVMLQPVACVINALEQLPSVVGLTAAVIGQGPIGVLFSHILKTMGAADVIGVDVVDRSDVAGSFKIDHVVHASSDQWAASLTEADDRPHIVVEAVGHQVGTACDAVAAVAEKGHIFVFGIPADPIYPFPMLAFLRKSATLTAGVTLKPARRGALDKAGAYLKTYPELPNLYITNVFSMDEAREAFELSREPAKGRLKVVLDTAQ